MQETTLNFVVKLKTLADTRKLGEIFAQCLTPPTTLALSGTLGSGKTELARSIASALGVPSEEVTSPTYVFVHRYTGSVLIYHIDFYRLGALAEVWDLGLDELFETNCLTIIEWADKFEGCLPEEHVRCDLEVLRDGSRKATISACRRTNSDWLSSFAEAWIHSSAG